MTENPTSSDSPFGSLDYRAIFHGATSVALIVIDTDDLVILETNTAADRLYGFDPGELPGTSVLRLSIDPDRTRSILKQACEGYQDISQRRIHLKKDGTPFPVTVSTSVSTIQGKLVVCKFVQDASGIERTERELIRSDQRFRAVADYTYDWESWLDTTGSPVWVNPAVMRFTGYSAEECLKMADYPFELIATEFVSKVKEIIGQALRGSTGNDVEFQVRHKDGSSKWIAVSWQPLRDDRNVQIGVRMSMRDIDQRKAMERQVQLYASELEKLAETRARRIIKLEQEKAHIEKLASLGELAASVAHEISNPLAGIKNALRLVIDSTPEETDSAELLKLVDQEIVRITALLRQMYQLYRPRTEQPKPIDIDSILREILLLNDGARAAKNLKITFENQPGPFKPVLPEFEFRQVMQNLLANAIEASQESGAIEIRCDRPASGEFVIEMLDHGHGIAPEIAHQIFEPFFTTKATPGKSGSGLGLAITRSLVLAMGGTIKVQSTVGGGTTFVLTYSAPKSPDQTSAYTVERA
ncbi:PAS domain S-box protein [bacterium]|nr:PAS domain S-box protein [bacterium]